MLSDRTNTALRGAAKAIQNGCKAKKLLKIIISHDDLWLSAYAKIYSNKGALTPGVDSNTLDGFSLARVNALIASVQDGSYRPTPVRRINIPKDRLFPKGKTRPLGIPNGNDKIVQEVMRMILETLYEPVFSEHSHGFRPQRSCHSALDGIKEGWKSTKWVCEVDIKGFFDNIKHQKLLDILRKRINDEAFMLLIKHTLKAGYAENWRWNATYSGTPQGGIVSPILANIYLNELDEFMTAQIEKFNCGKRRRANLEYKRLLHQASKRKLKLRDEANTLTQTEKAILLSEIAQYENKYKRLPSNDMHDPNFRRMHYVRYADDFLIGVTGTKDEARQIMATVTTFIEEELQLEVSKEKSRLNAMEDGCLFLGHGIRTRSEDKMLRTVVRRTTGNRTVVAVKRSITGHIHLSVPEAKCQRFVHSHGYGIYDANKPAACARLGMLNQSDFEIVSQFNAEMRGFANYYSRCRRLYLNKVEWIWQSSLIRTLGRKWQLTPAAAVRRLRQANGSLALEYRGKADDVRLLPVYSLTNRVQVPYLQRIDILPNAFIFRSRSELLRRLLANKCEYCSDLAGPFEVHHVRKMKDIAKGVESWKRLMIARQRKTLVLCIKCHDQLHAGRLSDRINRKHIAVKTNGEPDA